MTTIRVPEGYKYTGLIEKGGWQYDVWIQRMGNEPLHMISATWAAGPKATITAPGCSTRSWCPRRRRRPPPAPPVRPWSPRFRGTRSRRSDDSASSISVGGKVIFVAAVNQLWLQHLQLNNKKRTAVTEAGGWWVASWPEGFVSGALAGPGFGPPGAFVGGSRPSSAEMAGRQDLRHGRVVQSLRTDLQERLVLHEPAGDLLPAPVFRRSPTAIPAPTTGTRRALQRR